MTSQSQIDKITDLALEEDIAHGDATSKILIPENLAGRGTLLAKEEGLLVGGEVVRMVFLKTDSSMNVDIFIEDGKPVKPGDIIMTITGRVTSILKAERTALNFLSHLSGIATEVARYVAAVEGTDVAVADTRKTTPGMRMLEKYAVYAAGGRNQRPDLGSGILIKDNHLVAVRAKGISVTEAVAKTKKEAPEGMKVTVEVSTLAEVEEAIKGKPDTIMLDNMSIEDMTKATDLIPDDILVEASGGITLENVRKVAQIGVDIVSIGAMIHSARALDFSLEFLTAKSGAGESKA
jgi:nicotinate-nucleotide pyrophosphorylase (carboxylating)